MSNLFRAAMAQQANTTTNEKGALAYKSSLNPLVDFFLTISNSRNMEGCLNHKLFALAFEHNPTAALSLLLYARDIRGGQGERQMFKTAMKLVANKINPEYYTTILDRIMEVGRFDDIFVLLDTEMEPAVLDFWFQKICKEKHGLAAKWSPRKGPIASKIRKHFKFKPQDYRKMLVSATAVVETPMCKNEWQAIEYSHVPSKAMSIYKKAFSKRDAKRFVEYLESVKKGETKINASAIFPHDVVKGYWRQGVNEAVEQQWKALPDYLKDNTKPIIPMIDVSGSMITAIAKGITAMDVAISLGIYICERNEGMFKDMTISFSEKPRFFNFATESTVNGKMKQLFKEVGYNTDFNLAFKRLLDIAVRNKLKDSDMPGYVLALSDMQFDGFEGGRRFNMDAVREMYKIAGYTVPKMLFWNIAGRNVALPATAKEQDIILISGFSPSILKMIFNGDFNTERVLNDILENPRYKIA